MRDMIMEKLSKIEDLQDRKLLKNIMTGVFSNLIDYEDKRYEALKKSVFDEIEDTEKKYDIYITLCKRENYDPVNGVFYPMIKSDLEEKKYDMQEICKRIASKKEIKLFTVFMKCSYEKIKTLLLNNKEYDGEIVTSKGKHKIKIRLVQNKSYLEQEKKLHDIFQNNGLRWKTINNPYANKFFDVIITSAEGITTDEEILTIDFNLKEFEEYKELEIVPLWNIEGLSFKGEGFPAPARDKINFEHEISIKKLGEKNGFLVEDDEEIIKYIIRKKDVLNIVADREKIEPWRLLRIVKPEEDKYLSNKRKDNFINKYAEKQQVVIRTRGEINKIINSFEISNLFKVIKIEIKEKGLGLTYDMNPFIEDEIRLAADKKVISISFEAKNKEEFIAYDLLSFLISELQRYFPDYSCEGAII